MPSALITGASTGIGRDLTILCAEAGFDVVLVARNEALLNDLAAKLPRPARVIPKDLSRPEAPAEIYRACGEVDVLINNAGVAVSGLFHEIDNEDGLAMLQINVMALTHLTRLFLPAMVSRRHGRLLNVASTAAFQPGPLMAAYFASKAYVLSLSEALRNELSGTGVSVTCLCPGPTRTEFENRAGVGKSGLFTGGNVMDSSSVARAGFDGMMSGKSVVIPGVQNRAGAFATRLVPRSFAARLARGLTETR